MTPLLAQLVRGRLGSLCGCCDVCCAGSRRADGGGWSCIAVNLRAPYQPTPCLLHVNSEIRSLAPAAATLSHHWPAPRGRHTRTKLHACTDHKRHTYQAAANVCGLAAARTWKKPEVHWFKRAASAQL